MPRLVVVDGPSRGSWVELQHENFLGFRNSQLAISYLNDLHQPWAFLRVLPDRAELHNLGAGPHVLLNGVQFKNSFIRHGDIITIYDTRFAFEVTSPSDSNTQGSRGAKNASTQGSSSQSNRQIAQLAAQAAAQTESHRSGPSSAFSSMAGSFEEDLLSSISANTNEQIGYRVKFRDQNEMMGAMKDAKRMQILLRVASKLGMLNLDQLLKDLLDTIFEVMPCDRGSILLYSAEHKRFRTMASRTRTGGDAKVRISRTIAKEVLRTKESLLSSDAQSDQRFGMGLSIVDEDIRSALCVPILRANDEIVGLIHLDTQDEDSQFDKSDCELLTAIAMQAALAIENARLVNEIAEQERMKYELDLAATIQQQLLPRQLPEAQGVEVYGKMIPAKELGGDYFDFIEISPGEFAICVGDVSGKGLPAGLVMVMARSYLRPLIRNSRMTPRGVIAEANRLLHGDTRQETFMSAVLLRWSDRAGKFLWSGAGHEHLLVYRARTRQTQAIKCGGVVLAMVRDADNAYQDNELVLETGDAIVLYTDGVTEAQNMAGAFFAEETLDPLLQLVNKYGHLSAKDLLETLLWELRNFMGNAPQADDITLVTIKRL